MNRVIDASVACGWFFEESLSDAARKVAESDTVFFAPDMILAECANVALEKSAAQRHSGATGGRLSSSLAPMVRVAGFLCTVA